MHKNLTEKDQENIDKTISTINSVWNTWFPKKEKPAPAPAPDTTVPKVPTTPRQPMPPKKSGNKGLIYAGVGVGVLGLGFLIYKIIKNKKK